MVGESLGENTVGENASFPQVRHLVAISLSSAMVLDVQIGPVLGKHTGELSLLRRMKSVFRQGDVGGLRPEQ